MLSALNISFFVIHSALILFILFGWMWKRTRRAHLAVVAATAFCWFVVGIWYGFGYCPCTDWHWQVREQLGYHDPERSYITFLINRLTGANANPTLVDAITVAAFVMACALSAYMNLAGRHGSRRQTS